MGLLKDIKKDPNKKRIIRLVTLFVMAFFMIDALLGFILRNGLEKYYGLNDQASMAVIGHSHLMLGVDKTMLEDTLGIKVAKYTREGVNIADRKVMVEHLLNRSQTIKTVIYGVDAWTFTGEGLSENSHVLFYPFMNDKSIDSLIKSRTTQSEYWLRKLIKSTRYNEGLIASSIRGHSNKWDNFKLGEVDTKRLRKELEISGFRKINNDQENLKILKKTIEMLKKKQVNVVLFYVPTIDLVNDLEPRRFEETIQIFNQLEQDYDNVVFLNFLEPFSHKHELFYDPIHLNPKGQKVVTNQLIKELKRMGYE